MLVAAACYRTQHQDAQQHAQHRAAVSITACGGGGLLRAVGRAVGSQPHLLRAVTEKQKHRSRDNGHQHSHHTEHAGQRDTLNQRGQNHGNRDGRSARARGTKPQRHRRVVSKPRVDDDGHRHHTGQRIYHTAQQRAAHKADIPGGKAVNQVIHRRTCQCQRQTCAVRKSAVVRLQQNGGNEQRDKADNCKNAGALRLGQAAVLNDIRQIRGNGACHSAHAEHGQDTAQADHESIRQPRAFCFTQRISPLLSITFLYQ